MVILGLVCLLGLVLDPAGVLTSLAAPIIAEFITARISTPVRPTDPPA